MKLPVTFYLMGGLCYFFQDQAVRVQPVKHLIVLVLLVILAAVMSFYFVNES